MPETPKTCEVKSFGPEPLMDSESQIANPSYSYHLLGLHFDLFANHVREEDTFRVVNSGLYFQIAPSVHHFLEFIS